MLQFEVFWSLLHPCPSTLSQSLQSASLSKTVFARTLVTYSRSFLHHPSIKSSMHRHVQKMELKQIQKTQCSPLGFILTFGARLQEPHLYLYSKSYEHCRPTAPFPNAPATYMKVSLFFPPRDSDTCSLTPIP
ncbi:hypothetical protein EV356DRAFT_336875 [Viridothelium virens]|uniref:Uncharacterized protein n=1 Tax=Viridothelium virens TaxID=1048519 RepID=A0A6A6HKW4_VIRVR|nr:hypothetical protein EV356DRAFT_336875 [Viridothelium virens]